MANKMNDKNQLKDKPEEETKEDDDDLEEGELKDDEDDDDDDDEDDNLSHNTSNNNIEENNSNNNNNRSYPQPNQTDEPPLPMNHVLMGTGEPMFQGGEPGGFGPMSRVNTRCRFYSRTSNKCTWGDHCRFEHRDESPDPDFNGHLPPPPPPLNGPQVGAGRGGPPPPMSAPDQPYPGPYGGSGDRYQPYPNYHLPSAMAYERRHRLAYELAPWNGRGGGYGPPPVAPSRYERGDPNNYPPRGFYGNHFGGGGSREPPPYGYEPIPHPGHSGGGGAMYPQGYSVYPSAYRGGPPMGGPHVSHHKYMSSSQRLDTRRLQSNKRGHDEGESSWSDSGSEDSILGRAIQGNKNHHTKVSKQQPTSSDNNTTSDATLDQGSGTPPGEPLPEDRERQEMLLNKLKEIEDLMAKKKGEQGDSV